MDVQEKMKVLILDDEKDFTEELSEFLENSGIQAFEANRYETGLKILREQDIDVLVLDVRLGNVNGLEILGSIKDQYPRMEVIIVSGHGDMDTVIKALRLGAFDYLRKPFRHTDIQIALERTRKYVALQRRIIRLEEHNSLISKSLEKEIDRQLIGVSAQMKKVTEAATTAAKYPDANVLITGETGTGKENIARIIHYASSRKNNVFCAVNSSAITETLLESEFFGHKKGSFTGAITDKMGYFEVCDSGTLFLDEIADMPLPLQAKILRATEEKIITRVGDTRQIPTNFRVISATNHNLDERVKNKQFRLDLLHRLNTLHIHIPPLREHPDDIQPLLQHFAGHFSLKFNKPQIHIHEEVFAMLKGYDFPGNVRELRNMAERAIILSKGETLTPDDFPFKGAPTSQTMHSPHVHSEKMDLKALEMNLINQALILHEYNQTSTARSLGISRDALIRKMKKFGIVIKKTGRHVPE